MFIRGEGIVGRLGHIDVIVGMNGCLTSEWGARKLAAPIRNHLIHVHVELRAAPRHPNMEREHVFVAAGDDLIADLNNQHVPLVVEPTACAICVGCSFLQDGVCRNHLARHQVLPNAEMFERPLRLCPPKLGARNIDLTEAVGLFSNIRDFDIAGKLHLFSNSVLFARSVNSSSSPLTACRSPNVAISRKQGFSTQTVLRSQNKCSMGRHAVGVRTRDQFVGRARS